MYIMSHILLMMVEASSSGQREDNSKLHYQGGFLHICYMKVSISVVVMMVYTESYSLYSFV